MVRWRHDFPDEPVDIYSEIDDERNEIRKVQIFPDGRLEYADAQHETLTTGLAIITIPELDEIRNQPDFSVEIIEKHQFNSLWKQAIAQSKYSSHDPL